MGVKLKAETGMTMDAGDLREIITDYLCSSSYGAFADMQVTIINENSNGDFDLVLNPKPKEDAE